MTELEFITWFAVAGIATDFVMHIFGVVYGVLRMMMKDWTPS
jgi:hypothetical protein